MALQYATKEEFETYTGDVAPVDIEARLRSSSRVVRNHTRRAVYRTDTEGYPTDTEKRTALREATIEHVKFVIDHGIEELGTTDGTTVTSVTKTLGPASKSETRQVTDPTAASFRSSVASGEVIPASVAGILTDAGLVSSVVYQTPFFSGTWDSYYGRV